MLHHFTAILVTWGLRDYGIPPTIWGGDAGCEHEWSEHYKPAPGGKGTQSSGLNGAQTSEKYRERLEEQHQMKGVTTHFCRCGAWRGSFGLEPTYQLYVEHAVEVFREVRRVLRVDGTVWLNLGDSYATGAGRAFSPGGGEQGEAYRAMGAQVPDSKNPNSGIPIFQPNRMPQPGLKPKDLVGIPWRVAQALQAPFYTGRIKADRDRVWLAATLDAEGTICGFTHQRKDTGKIRRGIHVAITNSNVAMLDECYRIWRTSRHDHNAHGVGHYGKLDTFRWIAHDVEEKQQLMAELFPYLLCKKKQAALAWNFLEISKQARGRNKGDEGDQNRERSQWIVHALSRLNHLQSVDIPDWIKSPPSQYEPGWYLRQDVIWSKPNPMPESVTDRCTKAHEYLFLLSKSERYWFDADAISEPASYDPEDTKMPDGWDTGPGGHGSFHRHGREKGAKSGNKARKPAGLRNVPGASTTDPNGGVAGSIPWEGTTRNKRSVWTVGTHPFPEAHFATFPPALIEPCILAGCPEGGTILDPFFGAGTTGLVADRLRRNCMGIELNESYTLMAKRRIEKDGGMLSQVDLIVPEQKQPPPSHLPTTPVYLDGSAPLLPAASVDANA